MEDWINNYYDRIAKFFKIRKKLPLVLIENVNYLGRCRSVKYLIRETDTKKHTVREFKTGWQLLEIQLESDFVKACYEHQRDHLFPFVVRTLIHELVHQRGYILHTKKFKRAERRMFIRWIANITGKSIKCIKDDEKLMDYIFEYELN